LRAEHARGRDLAGYRAARSAALEAPRQRHRLQEGIGLARRTGLAPARHGLQPREAQRHRYQPAIVGAVAADHAGIVQAWAEVLGEQAGEHIGAGLRRHRIGQRRPGAVAAQDRQAIGRHVQVGLHVAREILHVAGGETAAAALLRQHSGQVAGVDVHHHRAIAAQRLQARLPPRRVAFAGEPQHHPLHRPVGQQHRHLLETAVTDRLHRHHRRGQQARGHHHHQSERGMCHENFLDRRDGKPTPTDAEMALELSRQSPASG